MVNSNSSVASRYLVVILVCVLMTAVGCMSRPPGPPRKSDIARPRNDQQYDPGLEDEDAPVEFTETESGLRYRILRKSDGPKPKAFSRVTCHYRGWLDSGKVFDESYKKGDPLAFSLDAVIPGWTEGVQLVGVGGMIELEIPYDLGYGEAGIPAKKPNEPAPIPPKTRLHFIVELLEIE